ncbi:secondary thiamine-phosphate synthase enzyme YjbQ [Alloalcanivorax profundimaris]|uniref:secondary thiamine-phosphate synthase enzyme YjbQ n=1 Tax=Alloalcanivorax profundimaris TaxID=2735259 RepID=UPI0018872626|nr:secondary thiamine-phosphate synthase enzyme YjbQ [Alloalcanivorax profundimaris]MBF1803019.1 YjbQ family protein [Alloalcanivorax profundimaris]MCQ6260622.1 secondary thiamine-phosphate synthase enzyme YjbQ [Alcanivorax sp. MM125-6]
MWQQRILKLAPRSRGFHLVTAEVLEGMPEIGELDVGLLHLFIQHTSASLAINENADPDVRGDLERHFNVMVPENAPHYEHTLEGPDDMPAHIKTVLIGESLTLPIRDGAPALGTWQGIYLCEHRDRAGGRRVVATLQGER